MKKWIRDLVARWFHFDVRREEIIRDGDRTIIVSDSLPPEANAMALAMYSRGPKSFIIHLATVLEKGYKKFLAKFYVSYGHKSIGDCGSTTVCAEGVSMLCAKAIQQYLLYKGQEASTRYLNMLRQKRLNPLGTSAGQIILEAWMNVYERILGSLVAHFREQFPIGGEKPDVYERAINARAFDIARAFLPASITTFVGWHTTLREAKVHLLELRHHPLAEVREVAEAMSRALHAKYPSSGFDKRYPEQEAFVESYMSQFTYMEPSETFRGGVQSTHNLDLREIKRYRKILAERPVKSELPAFMRKLGTITYRFMLDFGSFRDLQRHRSGDILMPPLTTQYGFHPWYLDQLPESDRTWVEKELNHLTQMIAGLECSDVDRQYYIAMGFQVYCEATLGIPAVIYISELRSGPDVHPTLRPVAQAIGGVLQHLLPPDAKLYINTSPDAWSSKRGTQTIIEKE